MQSKVARDELVEAFRVRYASFAGKKPKVSHAVVCGSASRQQLSKVLQMLQEKLDCSCKPVKSVKKNVSSFKLEDGFGEKSHTRSPQPYIYESSHCHVNSNKLFPVDEKGQLLNADYIDNSESGSQKKKSNDNFSDDESKPSVDELINSAKDQCTPANCVYNDDNSGFGSEGRELGDNTDDGESRPSGEEVASSTKSPKKMDNIPANTNAVSYVDHFPKWK